MSGFGSLRSGVPPPDELGSGPCSWLNQVHELFKSPDDSSRFVALGAMKVVAFSLAGSGAAIRVSVVTNPDLPRTASFAVVLGLSDNWWLFLLRGVAAIIFGLLSFVWPDLALVTLVLLFGVFVLADGVCALLAAVLGRPAIAGRWWLIIVGVLGIAAGGLTLKPGITALVLLFCIAIWAIATGTLQMIGAILLRKEIEHEWLLISTGALSLVFGIVMLLIPRAGILELIWLVAAYAIAFGFAMIGFAFRLRKLKRRGS